MCSTVQERISTCGRNAIVKIGERTNIRPQKVFSSPNYINVSLQRYNPEWGGAGQGVRTPLENLKAIIFLSNTGSDPLENHKFTKPSGRGGGGGGGARW